MRDLQSPGRSPVYAPTAMASTSHPLSSAAAIDILKAGGNAVDAAIAACAVQCVVEPQSTGIGGDNFCLLSMTGEEDIIAFNGSGKAPAAASVEWYQAQGITAFERSSAHSVTIPSAVDAWARLNADYGCLPFGELFQHAIGYARNGYPVAPRVYTDFVANLDVLQANPDIASVFLKNGQLPKIGDLHKHPALAATLETIAREGRDAFYHGDIAQKLTDYLHAKGGLHTREDFANTQGKYVTPIMREYRGNAIYQCPPNGQGVIALLLLNIIKQFDIDMQGAITTDRIHLELEACRLAYRARNLYVADPDFSHIPVNELLSDVYAKKLANIIDPNKAHNPPLEVDLPPHEDTVYISVVDKDRNACSFINTLFMGFGSGLMEPQTGIILHNRGSCFSLDPKSPNAIAGNKRPLHTIIPGMVKKGGQTRMSYGVMGGQYQAFGHMQFLSRFFDFGLDIQQAMDAPRFMVDPFTGEVEIERGVPEEICFELKEKGHHIATAASPIGGSQAIWIDYEQGVLVAGSDPRKDGCAIGY